MSGTHTPSTARPRGKTASRIITLVLVAASLASSGASCPHVIRGYQVGTMPLPRMLPPQPTLDQVIAAVHDNTDRVRNLVAPQATLSVPGVPRLSARVACEPPRRFRLQAQTSLTGTELDIGSNDDLFWLWLRQHKPPITAFCRHDQYDRSAAKQLMPIRADWMPELLGLVRFRAEDQHQGPFPIPDGRIEIRSRIAAADGDLYKSTILDATTGLVTEQHLFTAAGERLASVRTSRHRVDPPSGAALPHKVEVSWPTSQIDFTIELAGITTNSPTANPEQLWSLPQYEGYEPVDLADPSITIGPPAQASR